jgi:flagellum-specific peptidoglycan hydrolase FlgJ
MAKYLLPAARTIIRDKSRQMSLGIQKYWPKVALTVAATYLVYQKDLAIDLQLNNAQSALVRVADYDASEFAEDAAALNVANYGYEPEEAWLPAKAPAALPVNYEQPANVSNLANTYSNLTSHDNGAAAEPAALRASKRQKQLRYVKRFAKVAQAEMDKFGIPASITLAQGLLESNVGESKLAVENNNHFGIKCFSKTCGKGHCSNFTDDTHKDFFRKYKSPWESYRAHSQLLKQGGRYNQLFQLKQTDYRRWAKGLKAAGYATDEQYADKLIKLIEDLELHQYD